MTETQGSSSMADADLSLPLQVVKSLLTAPKIYFSPRFRGLEKVNPERPALWVGNHTLYGMLDVPLMIEHLYTQYGILVRSLGDQGHFKVPLWREFLQHAGMVMGNRDNCRALMKNRQHILVFPGGAREVWRRKGEAHKLIWKQRTGFARMAIEHGYDIIPFASIGPDHALDIIWDANDTMSSPLWKWLSRHLPMQEWTRSGETIPPIVRGLGLSVFPRPECFYYGFGERIPTSDFIGQEADSEVLWALRARVANSIEEQMSLLETQRQQEKQLQWSQLRCWLTR